MGRRCGGEFYSRVRGRCDHRRDRDTHLRQFVGESPRCAHSTCCTVVRAKTADWGATPNHAGEDPQCSLTRGCDRHVMCLATVSSAILAGPNNANACILGSEA